ncbi:MAG TPA: tRNA (adenosine(37)-N6)-dimethylallyltransferase MiaA [Candidatus Paceibacterota bacterium]
MEDKTRLVAVVGPTASGKTAKAIELALARGGEIISVDSRQVYRTLDIGTEKIRPEEMQGIPHHLIDIREPEERYSAGDFVDDATRLIAELVARGKTPILAGGTHFYFDALLNGLPGTAPPDLNIRSALEARTEEDLFAELQSKDARRAAHIDPKNKRRLVRALELVSYFGAVPERVQAESPYDVEWVVIDPPREVLRERIDQRLEGALGRGLIEEVRTVRSRVGDERLHEFGLEYRIIGEYLRGERAEESLMPALSSKLWHYARHQKKWLRKLVPDS